MRTLNCICLLLLLVLAVSATPQTPPEKARSVKFDGAKVNYVDYGKGSEALVFVHGWSCDLGFWNGNIPAFKDKTRVIATRSSWSRSQRDAGFEDHNGSLRALG